MPLENIPIDKIVEADLQRLVGQERERKTIEYKRDRIGDSDSNKKKFLADVSSFANAAGGHLIIGMAADSTSDRGFIVGLPLQAPDEKKFR